MEEGFQPDKTVRLPHGVARAESVAAPDKAELRRLITEFKAVQLNRINKESELAHGAQAIPMREDPNDPESNARRTRLIEYGRKLTQEIEALKVREQELADSMKARGEDPSVHAITIN